MAKFLSQNVLNLLCLLIVAAALTAWAVPADAYPRPKVISDSWQFDIRYGTPRLITVDLDLDGEPTYYWYLPYTVVNNTGQERLYVPTIEVLTDRGHFVQANQVDIGVYNAIADEQENELLVSPGRAVGRVLVGEDNAIDTVAIWPAQSDDVDSFKIFMSGLSGETTAVEHPVTGDRITLNKTLMLEYKTPGSLPKLLRRPVAFDQSDWVMR